MCGFLADWLFEYTLAQSSREYAAMSGNNHPLTEQPFANQNLVLFYFTVINPWLQYQDF